MLQFYSGNGEGILVMTYNDISLFKFKNNKALCTFRTKGNYGQGFIVGDYFGHIG